MTRRLAIAAALLVAPALPAAAYLLIGPTGVAPASPRCLPTVVSAAPVIVSVIPPVQCGP